MVQHRILGRTTTRLDKHEFIRAGIGSAQRLDLSDDVIQTRLDTLQARRVLGVQWTGRLKS